VLDTLTISEHVKSHPAGLRRPNMNGVKLYAQILLTPY